MSKNHESRMAPPAESDHGCRDGWVYSPVGVVPCDCGTARIFTPQEIADIEADLELMFGDGVVK